MKHMLLLSAMGIGLLTSCSTAFKAGQTPDDVYYSPGRDITHVTEVRDRQQQVEEYQSYVSSLDDRYLRMKVANHTRWAGIDDFDYWYDSRYDFGGLNYSYCYNTLSPYTYWNPRWSLTMGYGLYYPGYYGFGWNSPIYTLVHYSIPSYGGSTSTAASNITAFRNRSYNNSNYGYRDLKTGQFVPSGNNSSFGNLLKKVFTGSTANGTASSFDRPVRTFTNTPGTTNTTPSSNAGGASGGFKSTGTSTSTGRGGKG